VASIGIDAELHAPLPPGIDEMVCTEEELRWITSAPGTDRFHWATLIYSAKESLYKAWFPITGCWLGFDEAELVIDPRRQSFTAHVSVPLHDVFGPGIGPFVGRFDVACDYILTSVVMQRPTREFVDAPMRRHPLASQRSNWNLALDGHTLKS
jgi:4'-phosphopantetheinyl transferase EntD